jgi:hypothetical protein
MRLIPLEVTNVQPSELLLASRLDLTEVQCMKCRESLRQGGHMCVEGAQDCDVKYLM